MQAPVDNVKEIIETKELNLSNYIGLVDADYLIYRWAAGNNTTALLDDVLKDIDFRMETFKNDLKCKSYIHLVSSKHNFRHQLGLTQKYKGDRKASDKPIWFHEVYDYYVKKFDAIVVADMEADDGLSMLHDDDTVIITADKDLLQSPGKHVIIKRVGYEEVDISKQEGIEHLLLQLMIGDKTDHIPQLKAGVGEVGARKIIGDNIQKAPFNVFRAYMEEYGIQNGMDRFVEVYNLVRMRTSTPPYLKEKYSYLFDLLELHRKFANFIV